ncbi:MAG: autotransporter-associated beta strand repeat-containing protein [Pirellulales bacterium]
MGSSATNQYQHQTEFQLRDLVSGWRQALCWIGLAVACGLTESTASAQTTSWTNPTLGDWFIGSNWSSGVPYACSSCDHHAYIEQGTALINTRGAQADFLDIGGIFDASLLITNSGTLFQLEDAVIESGSNSALVTVSGNQSEWNAPDGDILVGGNGTLRIENGGLVGSDSGLIAGFGSGNGSVIVTGAGSTWAVNDMVVGQTAYFFAGTTTMTISNGGNVLSDRASIGGDDFDFTSRGSSGTVTVTGPGSIWDNTESVYVGAQVKAGALRINNGAYVQTAHLEVSSVGSVEVNNGSSTTAGLIVDGGAAHVSAGNSRGSLIVANTSSGRMVVQGGGTVSNSFGTIGVNSSTFGSVLVQGVGSTWTNTDQVSVGHGTGSTGTLEIRDGGTLNSVRGFAGAGALSTGVITVSDPGSTWTAFGSFFIGNSGYGFLEILNGGAASTAGNSYLGFSAGSFGSADVSGLGSTWTTAATLAIGGNLAAAGGDGRLTISDGGAVSAAAITLYSSGEIFLNNTTTLTGPITSFGGKIYTYSGDQALSNNINQASGLLLVHTTDSSTALFSGTVSGVGGLLKNGSGFGGGTLTLTGNNSYTGATIVNVGTLLVNGRITSATTVNDGATLGGSGTIAANVTNNGIVAPGNSPGTLHITGNYTQNAEGTLKIELASPTSFDRLAVTGNMALGGTLEISLIDGFMPSADQTFDILSWGSLVGAFSSVIVPTQEGLAWDTSQLSTGVISVEVSGLPGDYNQNGIVDAADYTVWRDTGGTQTGYDTWHANFGATLGSGANEAAAIPEPATSTLLLIALAIAFYLPRYRRLSPCASTIWNSNP